MPPPAPPPPRRPRASELLVLIPLLLIVVGAWGFVELAEAVREGSTKRFDDWAVRALRRPDDSSRTLGPAWLEDFGRDITALGGFAVLTLVIGIVAGFLWLQKRHHMVGLLLAASGGGLVLSSLLKRVMQRPRPELVPHLSAVFTTSFPSGHSMLSAVVYLSLGTLLARSVADRATKIYCIVVAAFVPFAVGLSRIYMGVHYPTDVLAGWTAGVVWAMACWTVSAYLQRRGDVEMPPVSSPGIPGEGTDLTAPGTP